MLYKLTYQDGTTRKGEENETQWGRSVTHTAKGKKILGEYRRLCTNQVIHAYRSPEIAAFANGLHADFGDPLCWSAKGWVVAEDGLKVGCKTLTTLEAVPLPVLMRSERVEISMRTREEEKSITWDDIRWARWRIREIPESFVAVVALKACDKRAFTERLTERIKRVIEAA